MRTPSESVLKKQRAAGAREYSTHEEVRRHYRDGFTDGWVAYEDALADAQLCKCRKCIRERADVRGKGE